jgi:hypothetical protein
MAYSPDTGKVYVIAVHEAPATRMIPVSPMEAEGRIRELRL